MKKFSEAESANMKARFKNEENVGQRIQKEIGDMKEEIKSIKMGSGTTVSREASTGEGPAIPRKLEFEGWSPDFTLKNIQGIPGSQVKTERISRK